MAPSSYLAHGSGDTRRARRPLAGPEPPSDLLGRGGTREQRDVGRAAAAPWPLGRTARQHLPAAPLAAARPTAGRNADRRALLGHCADCAPHFGRGTDPFGDWGD